MFLHRTVYRNTWKESLLHRMVKNNTWKDYLETMLPVETFVIIVAMHFNSLAPEKF